MKNEQLALREQSLLTAALNCFATERCEEVTVARIAKLAGVAKGTVYLHFKSKDEICARLAQDFYNGLAVKYAKITGDGATRLKKILETSFSHYREMQHYRHIIQYCYREHFLQSVCEEIALPLQHSNIVRRQHIAKALELGTIDQSLTSNAGAKLAGICSTLDGALLSIRVNTNTQQTGEKEFFDSVTNYILSSVGQKNTTTPVTNAHLNSPELTPEV